MNSLDDIFGERNLAEQLYRKATQRKPRSEREELVEKFTIRINQGRVGTQFRLLPPRTIAMKLRDVPTADLWPFYKLCEGAESFSRCFFGRLKPKHARKA